MAKTKKNRKSAVDVIKKVSKKQAYQNPFEVHVNKSKFKVLGQKSKNDVGLPGVSRSKAIQKRKVTLLQEYKFQDKTNKFFDRRIGEHNKNMTKEDKIMARFTAEKMKAHTKSSMFNLDDDVILTHGGRTLEEIEQFEDPRSDDDDDEDGRNMKGTLDSAFVKEAHFGGGMLSVAATDGELSRKDLISQLIADSKQRKAEKQQLKESTMKLTEQLDSEWKDLLPLLHPVKSAKESEFERTTSAGKSSDATNRPPPVIPPKPAVDKGSFDYLVKELRFEATGKPSDKLKSEDEIVRLDKERLEKLERERLRRMTLHEADEARARPGGRAYKSADDLDDGFAIEDVNRADDGQSENGSDSESDDDENGNDRGSEKIGEDEDEVMEEEKTSNKGVKRKLDEDKDDENDDETDSDKESEDEEEEGSSDEDSFDDLVDDSEEDEEESDSEVEDEQQTENEKNSDMKTGKSGKSSKVDSKSLEVDGKSPKNDGKSLPVDGKSPKVDGKSGGKNKLNESADKKTLRFAEDEIDTLDESNSSQLERQSSKLEPKPNQKKGILRSVHNQNEDVEMRAVESKDTKEMEEALCNADLPFTFEVPREYEELVELFDGRGMRDVRIILERMVKVNHWSLGGDNKAKLNQLFAFLLQYLDDSVDPGEPKKCWQVLNSISPVLFDLCLMDPDTSGGYLRSVIQEKYETYSSRDTRYPSVHSLIFLKLVSTLFPASDARHYVTTPALIFLCHALGKAVPVTTRDVAGGLFLATLCVEYIELSKRYLPELVNYLHNLLLTFCSSPPHPFTKPFKSVCRQLLAFTRENLALARRERKERERQDEESSPGIQSSVKSVESNPLKTARDAAKATEIDALKSKKSNQLKNILNKSGKTVADSSIPSKKDSVQTEMESFFTITAGDLCSTAREISPAFKAAALTSALKLASGLLDKYEGYEAAYLIFENSVSVLRRLREELTEGEIEEVGMKRKGNDRVGESVEKTNKGVRVNKADVKKANNDSDVGIDILEFSSEVDVIVSSILERLDQVISKFDALKQNHPFKYVAKEKEKPKILRLFEPEIKPVLKFHTKGAQKEREKLLSKYKKEMKGAIREIRKDGRFLQKVKLRQQLKEDEVRQRKVKEILGGCANQEGEIRNLKRKKK